MRALLVILLLAGTADAMIVCNGDSNTQSNWQGFPNGTADGWCEQLGALKSTTTVNRGVGFSGIGDHGTYYGGTLPLWGGFYIDAEAAGTDPFLAFATGTPPTYLGQPTYSPLGVPDTFVLAFGTNDLMLYGYTPRQIITYYKKYRQHAIATGATVYIATTPPQYDASGNLSALDAQIQDLNQRIRGNWPTRYVEFYNGFTPSDFAPDGVHLNASGQAKRAAAAAAVIP